MKRPDGRETRRLLLRENKDEERNGWNEESLKRNKFGKTRKDIRWKRGEFVVVEMSIKQNESEDGGLRELREKFEFVEVGKHSRGKGCQLVVMER